MQYRMYNRPVNRRVPSGSATCREATGEVARLFRVKGRGMKWTRWPADDHDAFLRSWGHWSIRSATLFLRDYRKEYRDLESRISHLMIYGKYTR